MGRSRSPRPAASTMAFIRLRPELSALATAARSFARGNSRTIRSSRKRGKLRQLGIPRTRIPHILERQWQIPQVPRLAVAIPQARKNPEHLDVPLHSDQIEPAQELAIVAASQDRPRERSSVR